MGRSVGGWGGVERHLSDQPSPRPRPKSRLINNSMTYPLSDDDRLPLKDLVKNVDEIKAAEDIVNIWHIKQSVAEKIF